MSQIPSTGLVDSFTRANETPLASPWAQLDTAIGNNAKLVSNQVLGNVSTSWNSYYSSHQVLAGDQEWFITVATLPDSGNNANVLACVHDPGGSNTWDGYIFRLINTAGVLSFQLQRSTNNVFTTIGAVVGTPPTPIAGDKIAVQVIGGVVKGWLFHSGSWTEVWTANDSTYTTGYGGIGGRGITVALDDFSGGALITDSATVILSFTPSGPDLPSWTEDAGTKTLALSPSSSEVHETYDSGALDLIFGVSALEEHSTYDSGTLPLTLTPSGLEHALPYDSELRITASSTKWTFKGIQRHTITEGQRWSVSAVTK